MLCSPRKDFWAEFQVREKELCDGFVMSAAGVPRCNMSALHLPFVLKPGCAQTPWVTR